MNDYKPSVLLIDDNETDNLISRKILEITGYASKINICTSGVSALQYLEERIDKADELPDVLFLDINMPIVDGFVFLLEFEKLAKKMPKDIEIIVLSSSDSQEDITKMAGHPRVVKFITKPISSTAIHSLIEA
jgi:CheY-like chemotaxis protein